MMKGRIMKAAAVSILCWVPLLAVAAGFKFQHYYLDRDLPGSSWGQTAIVDADLDGKPDYVTGRNAFDRPNVEGCIGMMDVKDPRFAPEDWDYLMRRQLHLPPKTELHNGSRSG